MVWSPKRNCLVARWRADLGISQTPYPLFVPGRTNDNALGMSGFLAFAMGEMEPSIDAVRPLVYYAPTPTRQWQAMQKMPYGILGEHALQYNHEPDRNADRKQADVS